jgi:multiple sugar transport system substrate-binding protein
MRSGLLDLASSAGRWILPALGLLALLACTGQGNPPSTPPPEPVRLTLAVSLLPAEQAAYLEIAEFVAAELGFEIEVISIQYEDIRRALSAEVLAGRGTLDIVEVDVFDMAAVAPHVRTLSRPPDAAALNSAALEAGVIGGELRFLPHRLAWQALICNVDEIEEPPSTWEELLALAEEHSGAIGLKADAYEGLTCDLLPFLWQAGGDPLDPESPANAAALRFLRSLGPHLNPSSVGYREGSILTAQEHGEIVLHLNWPFAVPQLRDAGLLPERHRAFPLPAGPAGRATVLGGGYLGVSAVTSHAEEAERFVIAMTGAEAQRALVRRLGWFPVRDDGWEALSESDRSDFGGFIAMAGDVRARPVREEYAELSALWQEAFRRAVFDEEDVAGVLSDIAARMPGR